MGPAQVGVDCFFPGVVTTDCGGNGKLPTGVTVWDPFGLCLGATEVPSTGRVTAAGRVPLIEAFLESFSAGGVVSCSKLGISAF